MRQRLCWLLLLAATGCPDRTIGKVDPDEEGQIQKDIPVSADLDLLFVIDNSASTTDKQTVFAANFPNFVTALDNFPVIGRPNLHVGVVTTSVDIGTGSLSTNCPHPMPSDDGLLQNAARVAGCTPPTGRFLSDIEQPNHTRTVNYTGTLSEALSCIAQVGATGCGFEAPLEAMKRALDGTRVENQGFLRPDAFLAVVILTDEDDCSAKDPGGLFSQPTSAAGTGDFRCSRYAYQCDTAISPTTGGSYHNCRVRTDSYLRDPQEYADFLSTVKPPGRSVVAVVGGDPTSDISTGKLTMPFAQDMALLDSCHATINGNFAIGRPGIRLNDFAKRFGDHGLYSSVCQSDYSKTLTDIGNLIYKSISPCLEGDLITDDVDPNNPGVQLDCTVSDVQSSASGGTETESPMPACKMVDANTPMMGTTCWWSQAQPTKCMTPTTLELEIVRAGAAPPGTNVRVRCATKPQPTP